MQKANQMEDRICNVLTQQENVQLQTLAKKFLDRLAELEQEQSQTKSDRRYFKREEKFYNSSSSIKNRPFSASYSLLWK